uniref:Uncharacterized protein n=1 Tax=viral metagenome TaxID=1070528 RepID=A0A6H1ZEJ9_9ZZZZ
MAATYPGGVKNFSAVVNGVTKLVAALFNAPYEEITAIETAISVCLDSSGYVKSTGLKTTQGEVSTTSTTGANLTLPGGEYGFYPRVKTGGGNTVSTVISVGVSSQDTYITIIGLTTNAGTCYAQQRYVTASGKDLWVFLLIDKITKAIVSAYQAPDHPAYGNGGDFDKMPHPFGSYDEAKYEIVLLDNETCLILKEKSKQSGKSILTLVNEEYKPNMSQEENYAPLHSGEFLDKMPVLVESIPDYIKVRKMLIMTEQDKADKQRAQELKAKEIKDAKEKIKNNIKLKLDLTDEDLDNLKKAL